MNCKPGNLAFIARLPSDAANLPFLRDQLLGAVVRVTTLKSGEPPIWAIEKPLMIRIEGFEGVLLQLTAVEDQFLTPIDGVPLDEDVLDEVTA